MKDQGKKRLIFHSLEYILECFSRYSVIKINETNDEGLKRKKEEEKDIRIKIKIRR